MPDSAPSVSGAQPLHLGASTATPGEPQNTNIERPIRTWSNLLLGILSRTRALHATIGLTEQSLLLIADAGTRIRRSAAAAIRIGYRIGASRIGIQDGIAKRIGVRVMAIRYRIPRFASSPSVSGEGAIGIARATVGLDDL